MIHKPKKILIASLSAGSGHVRAAEALFSACKKYYPEIEVKHIDLADYSDWIAKKATVSSYEFSAKHIPKLYGLLYRNFNFKDGAKLVNTIVKLFKINLRGIRQIVNKFDPDIIICTNFLAPAMIGKAGDKRAMDLVLTDYDLNQVFLPKIIRNFYTPTKKIADDINKIRPNAFYTGIPLRESFLIEKNIDKIKKDFNLNTNYQTILIMTGGTGLADSSTIVKTILKNFSNINLIVNTGKNNPNLYNKLKKLTPTKNINYKLIEFTEKLDELMRVADITITKPGGLALTECMYLQKPILLINPIPGQEEANVKFITENNYGKLLSDQEESVKIISAILNKTIKLSKPHLPQNAALDILKIAIN